MNAVNCSKITEVHVMKPTVTYTVLILLFVKLLLAIKYVIASYKVQQPAHKSPTVSIA